MKKYLVITIALLFNITSNGFGQDETINSGCTTVECHGNLVSNEVVHTAVLDGCDKCHLTNAKEHPQVGVAGFSLKTTIPQLCYSCHDENNTNTNVHSPVAKGECLTCHTPHSSPKFFLLNEDRADKLCAKCHDVAMTQKKYKHAPVEQGLCYKCHDPHDSDNKKFLKNNGNDLCLKCHKNFKEIFASEDIIHNPAAKDCLKCHDPHSSDNEHLTKKIVPDLCYNCHDPKNTDKNVHDPVSKGKCMTCHNPHNSPAIYLLKENPPSTLCFKCHVVKIKDKAVQHQPVAEGMCALCHDPHQSENNKLLIGTVNKVCIKCHKEVKEQLKLKTVHAPFADNCINCHDQIHGSNEKYLFDRVGKDLCLKCHDKQITTATGKINNIKSLLDKSKFTHGAIVKSGCVVCHSPHASANSHLLNATFPEGVYAEGNKENFALCFTCHEPGLLEEKNTTTATGFRNGSNNLHFLHVNKVKGRSCNACHNPHAANNKNLIGEKVTFGNWDMPINYELLEGGGSCRPGCHAEKKYER